MNMETGYELNVPVGDGNKDVKAIISNNEVIWERAIPTPKSGVAPLSFRATRAKPLLDWEITGKTYQAWTPSPEPQIGNNKLDNSKIEKSATVTNFAYTDSSVSFGSMTVGSTINSAEIKSEDTSYAFSFTGDTNKVTFVLRCYNSSHTYLGDANKIFDETGRAVMTTLANTVYVRLYITTTVQGNISLTNLMLNKGNTVMAFEPFGYLPNTGACPVQGVGDKTENLFDKTKVRVGWYSSSTSQIILSTVDGRFVSVKVKPDTTYTFSNKYFNISSERNTIILTSVYPEDERTDYNTILSRSYSTETWSFTTGSEDNYANIMFARSATDEEIEKIVNTIMLNEGSEPLPYKPFGYEITIESGGLTTPIYLNSPLMADETLDSTGKREVKMRELVLTGDEQWLFETNNRYYLSIAIGTDSHLTNDTYCSHLPYNTNVYVDTGTQIGIVSSKSGIRIRMSQTEEFDTVSKFKAWLRAEYAKGTPVTVYYPLATPASETVDVPQIPTFKGNNVIDINTEVQPSNVGITYLSSGFEPQPLKTADGQILYTNNNQPLSTLE